MTTLLSTDIRRRPRVHDILKMPIIKDRIKEFLTTTVIGLEFNHTVFHKKDLYQIKVDEDIESNKLLLKHNEEDQDLIKKEAEREQLIIKEEQERKKRELRKNLEEDKKKEEKRMEILKQKEEQDKKELERIKKDKEREVQLKKEDDKKRRQELHSAKSNFSLAPSISSNNKKIKK